jgi:uncharacterized ParB-like nuclease family protein
MERQLMNPLWNGLKSPLWNSTRQGVWFPLGGSPQAGGGSSAFDPLTLYSGGKKGIWIKPRDWTTLRQWYLGTTNVTAATDPVGYAADQSGRGNNCVNAYAGGRPIAAIVSSRNCIDFDGADDKLVTAEFSAGTLTASMDCFFLVNLDAFSANGWLIANDNASSFFGVAQNGLASSANSGAGTPRYNVNGVAVTGGTSVTRDQLYDALSSPGSWMVVDACGLDLSGWLQFQFGGYPTFQLNGKLAEIILCESVDDATRARIRTYLGSALAGAAVRLASNVKFEGNVVRVKFGGSK